MSIFQHPLLLVVVSFLLFPVASQSGQGVQKVTSGHPTSSELVKSATDCQAAAKVLIVGWAGPVPPAGANGDIPPGCVYQGLQLRFNTETANKRSCGNGIDSWICLSIQPCQIGNFQNEHSVLKACKSCPVGWANDETGSTLCKVCQAGMYNNENGRALCKRCTGGRYSYTSETGQAVPTCTGPGCKNGTYSSEIGIGKAPKCKPCRAGRYNNETGRSSCEGNCTAGTFSSEIGQTTAATCLKCVGGQYSSETGMAECKGNCTVGKYSSEVGKTTSKSCKSCSADMYNNKTGKSTCRSCPTGWTTNGLKRSSKCGETRTNTLYDYPFVVGAIIATAVVGILFIYIRRLREKNEEHDVELGVLGERFDRQDEINQLLLANATNPLEQDQFAILPEDLNLGPRIGAGGCGLIYKATLGANTVVAAKEIITAMMNPKDLKEFEHEARMLTQMNHPHVLRVLGFCTILAEDSTDDMEHKYIVTEFAPHGSLENAIEDAIAVAKVIKETDSKVIQMPFTKLQALEWALQIASGMTFCHRRGFIHRDLKPQNILLNKSNDALVADLGTVRNTGSGKNPEGKSSLTEAEENEKFEALKRQMTEGESGVDVLLKTIYNEAMTRMTGTPMYMSPEQYRFTYSYPVDVYAYGLMMIRLFTLKLPYPIEVCTTKQLMDGGRAGVLVPTQVMPSDVPDPIVLNVINDCLQKYPDRRPTFKQIEHKLSEALKKCQTVKNKETKSNEYLTALDGTMFTLPSRKTSIQ
jgi:serine/threonine protein kinase